MRGAPIRYAFSIPDSASHPGLAVRFAAFLLSGEGRRVLESEFLRPLPTAEPVGTGIPASLDSLMRPPGTSRQGTAQ
jgi:hypothetical protein